MSPLAPKRLKVLGMAVLFVSLVGCTTEQVSGDKTIYTFAWWVPTLVLIASAIASVAGWFVRRWSTRFGWAMIILGPIGLLVLGPGLLLDHVTVDPRHFELRTGFWFMPTRHDIQFADLDRLEVIEETRQGRRKSTSYYLMCYQRSGGSAKVPIGDLMRQGAAERIVATARGLGIQVIDRLPR